MKVENNTQQKNISLILSKKSCYVSGKKKQENRGGTSKPFKNNRRKKKQTYHYVAGQKMQWVKHLLCMPEDLYLAPQKPTKN